jgi:hypothetical protein
MALYREDLQPRRRHLRRDGHHDRPKLHDQASGSLGRHGQILQTNPQLGQVAGDLFIKNMDWPGAQEMAARFKKILDPKVLAEGDSRRNAALDTGDLIGGAPEMREMPNMEQPEPQPDMGAMAPQMPEMAPEQPPEGMM